MPFLSWEEYVFSRNAQNNLDGRLVTFSKAFRETALLILFSYLSPPYSSAIMVMVLPVNGYAVSPLYRGYCDPLLI